LLCFEKHGIARNHVSFDAWREEAAYLEWCQGIDVLLDATPGSGGLSVLPPLWMGVPVIALAATWPGARQTASLLMALGLSGCVATTDLGYVAAAADVAGDGSRLAEWRRAMRGQFSVSGLLDGCRIARRIVAVSLECLKALRGEVTANRPTKHVHEDPKRALSMRADRALAAWLRQGGSLVFPAIPDDHRLDASVIVVLYNNAGLSRMALQALLDQEGAAFEVVVIDNASSDRTGQLLARVSNVRWRRNEVNVGFLAAANEAASMARGRHLVFLNNDAILQPGALAAAVGALDRDKRVGVVGGRVVLAAGGLQEAGNRIYADGSAAGLLREEDPFGAAARVRRPTDYCSGVFFATPKVLWGMLGGFDPVFAPAYYEDTDYCVRVWKAGLRVQHDPSILVEHVESASAPVGWAAEQMRKNQVVFLAKHRDWLSHQPQPPTAIAPPPAPAISPLDRDPQQARVRVLAIDNQVPIAIWGGGLPRARSLLMAMQSWSVTFFPLWQLDEDVHRAQASLSPDIEVVLGVGMAGLEAFLERRHHEFELLLVSRPPNLAALRPLRARRPDLFARMRLVYDAEAVFATRDIAHAALRKQPMSRANAASLVSAEIDLARGADSVLVVSDRDASLYRQQGHRAVIAAHSVPVSRGAPGAAKRQGLLFVGAILPGTPNEDGLIWFIEKVLPKLVSSGHVPKLRVAGVCQSPKVAALASPQVEVLGPQDNLQPLYDAARVFVAPARFSGGVPAKVIEAAAAGLPVVASSVLVRQLGWRDGVDIIGARDADRFAAAIRVLLFDHPHWNRQQAAAWDTCESRYDPVKFSQAVQHAVSVRPS
jgi:GT2 family glycosyltransferase/glycosyltransferase involved in cell wall biosynthesis